MVIYVKNLPNWERAARGVMGTLAVAFAVVNWGVSGVAVGAGGDFEELTIAEIAQRLGEPPGAVKSRLHRARELVREYMLGPARAPG